MLGADVGWSRITNSASNFEGHVRTGQPGPSRDPGANGYVGARPGRDAAQTCMEVVKEGHDRLIAAGFHRKRFVTSCRTPSHSDRCSVWEVNGTFSDAAYKISKRAKPVLFREGWERIFELSDIREQVRDITRK